jgi:hypothetical protein
MLGLGGVFPAFGQTGVYTIDGNGSSSTLNLQVDNSGNVTGTVYGQPIFGLYDRNSRHLVFERIISRTDLTQNQLFDGFYWTESGCGGAVDNFLAGWFQGFQGSGGTASLNRVGWYAFTYVSCIH